MRALGNQHADKREQVQRYKKEDRRWQDREKFFLELLKYLVRGIPLFTTDSVVQSVRLTIPQLQSGL